MNEVTGLLIRQIVVMFLYMAVGFWLLRSGKLTKEGTRDIAALLVNLVIPAVVLKSYSIEPTAERVQAFGISTGLALVLLLVAMAAAQISLGKNGVENFAAAFSNAGFIGIPMVQAVLGQDAVFYIVSFVALLNILQWTYGVAKITEKPIRFTASVVLHPLILGALVGIVLFLTGWGVKMPSVISGTLSGIAALNAPLAMIVLGGYLAQAKLPELLKDPGLWAVSALRLVVIPVLSLLVLKLLGVPAAMAMALLLAASAPVGSNVAVYAQLYQKDYVHASATVVLSTILSMVSMPLVISLADLLLH